MKPVIAIDGPAASGKGTLSRKIAEALNFAHMDTGALYRAVALEVLENDGNPEDESQAIQAAERLSDKINNALSPNEILSTPALRAERTGNAAAKVAAVQRVRDILLSIQRSFAENPGETYKGAVLDGRDIGSVVCPNADLKLYAFASAEIRAKRRTKELQSAGQDVTYEAVLKDMRDRDARDSSRSASPLTKADDAITFDTGMYNQEDMLKEALKIVQQNITL